MFKDILQRLSSTASASSTVPVRIATADFLSCQRPGTFCWISDYPQIYIDCHAVRLQDYLRHAHVLFIWLRVHMAHIRAMCTSGFANVDVGDETKRRSRRAPGNVVTDVT